MSGEFEATIVVESSETQLIPSAAIASRSHISAATPDATAGVSARFGEATRLLLRKRLLIAAITLVSIMLAASVIDAMRGKLQISAIISRIIGLAVLVPIFAYIKRSQSISLVQLRCFEIAVICVPIADVLVLLFVQTEYLIAQRQSQNVPILQAFIGTAIATIIAVYGMFVPGTWRRTLLVTGVIACLPTLAIVVHSQLNSALNEIQLEHDGVLVGITMFTFFMAGIATAGAHVVHGIRRKMEEARQYGQYRLTTEIGRGAMGVVYKAEHRLLKRPAAIKLIRADSAQDEHAIETFEREVQISATLSHWNTVQIYDYGRTADGDFYYVMEFLEGETLQDRLNSTGPMDVTQTIAVITQLCDGLEEAHAKGMVHRDLKPANIFLAKTGGVHDVVKILDFGLATTVSQNSADVEQVICGTPSYMSPEQIRADAIDGRSDIYAIGCVMFECLTGTLPFADKSVMGLLDKHLNDAPSLIELPENASRLQPMIAECLSKDRTQRPADVASLRKGFATILAVPTR